MIDLCDLKSSDHVRCPIIELLSGSAASLIKQGPPSTRVRVMGRHVHKRAPIQERFPKH